MDNWQITSKDIIERFQQPSAAKRDRLLSLPCPETEWRFDEERITLMTS